MDASGIAVINEPGSGVDSVVYKKPLRPHRFVVRPRFGEVLERIGPQTNFIMLHSRATTVGDTSENFNNHPIVIPPIIGVHNGTLFNEDRLFKKFKDDFPREGEVDSEIIFRLYQYHTDVRGLPPKQAITAACNYLFGAYTGAVIDMRHPHRMVMFKYQRSLCALRLEHYDMVIAISEAKFYDQAARKLGIKAKDRYQIVKDGSGFLVDLNIDGRITDSIIDFDIPAGVGRVLRRCNPWFTHGACG
jgi:glucosamine 6-phosphate synthetase-like amidotransferase/phosphosugar isomerase protein